MRSVVQTPQEPRKHKDFLRPSSAAGQVREDVSTGTRVRNRLPFTLGLIIMVLSLCSGLVTYLVLTGLTPIIPTQRVVVVLLLINLLLVLAMLGIIAWQVTGLWIARRRHEAGAQLHVRIVSLFSVIAVAPAILLAVFASVSLDRGLDHWFSSRTKSIIQNSIDVATAYLQEHGQVIRADTVGMAKDIDEAVELVRAQPQGFGNFLTPRPASARFLPPISSTTAARSWPRPRPCRSCRIGRRPTRRWSSRRRGKSSSSRRARRAWSGPSRASTISTTPIST
ncbi:hypothetical protein AUC71_09490 [Methyloceanibacter marginalis]|uniref:Nitrogen regulation protein NtrY-like N-terminal domain-containing protein n=1 Tax=Methyloceanibacter marginalis TaxID=1774971 RepID=A0A1E3WCE7_9HYPH|nr:hypothetical protein [Methyloceanibacter marginalis]ODS03471.1 hypothetical protein AUC71_09490 [Methyloceanibacter marginalis]